MKHSNRQAGIWSTLLLLVLLVSACAEDPPKNPPVPVQPVKEEPAPPKLEVPTFDSKSAYDYIQKQVDFGPRVPNSEAHIACAEYLASELGVHGLEVQVQEGTVVAYNGESLRIRNIVGRFNPEATQRLMLFAHWDTRPFADRDNKRVGDPIDGANDGGSGVGVLLEIARVLNSSEVKPYVGVDIFFFDAEDYGQPSVAQATGGKPGTWCLGTQYWAKNMMPKNYKPKYGILLDMVGASDAVFAKEGVSMFYAPGVVNKVWKKAHALGYEKYFSNVRTGELIDDHRVVNQMAKIPAIDIVDYRPSTNDFGPFHHRHTDNMDIIDEETLHAVGHTLLEVIYSEY